ncbi:MAG: metallophosphoesterase, partial [Nostocoides sp.]
AGFNDPRFFGDSGKNTAEEQKPATAAFKATFAGHDQLDIAVSHEPSAVRGLTSASLLLNGHMHVPALEGNRIQIGTFTGGGPFSHFLENASGEELVGQPSAFDIAAFGGDCRLATLTRYTFHNVIEGRPVYDGVSLVNGAAIQEAPAKNSPERACGPGTGRQIVDVPAVSTATPAPTPHETTGGSSAPGALD